MKKIFFFLPNLEIGGAERFTVNFINSIAETQAFKITLVLFDARGPLLSEVNSTIDIINLGSHRIGRALLKIPLLLSQNKPDIVFSNLSHVNVLLSFFIPFFPKVRWIARETNITSMMLKKEKFSLIFNIVYLTLIKKFNTIVCQSYDMAYDLKKNYKIKNNVIVINNFYIDDFENIFNGDQSIESNSPDKVNFCVVSRLHESKNIDKIIKAFQESDLIRDDITLTIIGDGPARLELEGLVNNSIRENIKFIGYKNNPKQYIASADYLILYSQHEGFPNTVLEAFSVGIPVITHLCLGGINELICDSNGILLPYLDHQKLASTLSTVKKRSFSKSEIIDIANKKFSKEQIFSKYLSILKE